MDRLVFRGIGPRAVIAVMSALSCWCAAAPAAAYRPFDGTDADVAPTGEIELEVGPAQYYREGHQDFLTVPTLVFNLGVFSGTELIVDAQQQIDFEEKSRNAPRPNLRGDDLLLKHVFRRGVLQDRSGVSIAAEGGALLPEVAGLDRFGASLDIITSYAWWWGALHYNESLVLDRDRRANIFTGLIAEGPQPLSVRPVAELFYNHAVNGEPTWSLLLGAIWRAHETLAMDVGARGARVGNQYAAEARVGFTWSFTP